jgi:hypothetical protein
MRLPLAARLAPCVVCGYDRTGLERTAHCPECGSAPQRIKPTHMSRWEKVGVAALVLIPLPPAGLLGLIAVIGAAMEWARLAPDTPRIHRQSLVVGMVSGSMALLPWLALGLLVLVKTIGPLLAPGLP